MSSLASTKKMTCVSKVILGCMTYGSPTWAPWLLSEEEGIRHIKAAYEAGINTFDTANVYSNGLSEVILGKAIKELNLPREEIVVMTKVSYRKSDQDGYVNQWGGSRKVCRIIPVTFFATVKASLERLQLEYIDVLQYHRVDPFTPSEEKSMPALHDVVKAGYVLYIGMSSCRAWQFHIMQNYAITNKLTPFISMQNHYNLVYREEEREMFPTLKIFTYLEEIAKKKEVTMAQVALAWSLSKEGVAAPVFGTTSIKNLMDLIDAVDLKLTEEEIKYLEEPYEAQAIYGFY
ncbi:Aldo/keto reductase [Gymnopus androsaceus JB14]|uniref:Aldo/keto reductase n=1 Tax=Gymnopus androsaceus JB14 TaxID=1447944 RepID=A0A6A4IKD4_9AGAR|nr:Aldo/keto reductase [Gymnopus androsaceus JB14]